MAQQPGPGGSPVLGALRSPVFWLLSGSFFICGASSNGIIGVHFVPHSIDHGIPEVTAASVLAIMGAMNFVGTLAHRPLRSEEAPGHPCLAHGPRHQARAHSFWTRDRQSLEKKWCR